MRIALPKFSNDLTISKKINDFTMQKISNLLGYQYNYSLVL